MFLIRFRYLFGARINALVSDSIYFQESRNGKMIAVEDQVQNMERIENFRSSQESFMGRAANKLRSDRGEHQELRHYIAIQKEFVKLAEKAVSALEEKTENQDEDLRRQQEECTSVSEPIANVKAFARAMEVSYCREYMS
jgi:hypothetical protein